MIINLEQKEIHFDLGFILTYNIYDNLICVPHPVFGYAIQPEVAKTP